MSLAPGLCSTPPRASATRIRGIPPLVLLLVALVVPIAAARADENPPASSDSTHRDDLSAGHRDLDATRIERAPPGEEWWRELVKRFPACPVLTDGCQSCVNGGDSLTCSNPGIACLRGEWRCDRTAENQRKDPPKDEPKTEPPKAQKESPGNPSGKPADVAPKDTTTPKP